MSAHFIYEHLPASNLGEREPRRPYVTGGLGTGIVYYTLLRMRYASRQQRRSVDATVEGKPIL